MVNNNKGIEEILERYSVEEIANGLAKMIHRETIKDVKDETIENLKKAIDITKEVDNRQLNALYTLIDVIGAGCLDKDIETIKDANREACNLIKTGRKFLQGTDELKEHIKSQLK